MSCTVKNTSKQEVKQKRDVELSFDNIKINDPISTLELFSQKHKRDSFWQNEDLTSNKNERALLIYDHKLVTKSHVEIFGEVTVFGDSLITAIEFKTHKNEFDNLVKLISDKYGIADIVNTRRENEIFSREEMIWKFKNDLEIKVHSFVYSGQSYGPFAEIASSARNLEKACITYRNLRLQNQYDKEQKRIRKQKIKDKIEKDKQLETVIQNQDI